MVCMRLERTVVVSLRLKYSTLIKYERLVALARMLDPDMRVTRSWVMRAVLERAVDQLLKDPQALLAMLRERR